MLGGRHDAGLGGGAHRSVIEIPESGWRSSQRAVEKRDSAATIHRSARHRS
jgi:hypothetical protein